MLRLLRSEVEHLLLDRFLPQSVPGPPLPGASEGRSFPLELGRLRAALVGVTQLAIALIQLPLRLTVEVGRLIFQVGMALTQLIGPGGRILIQRPAELQIIAGVVKLAQ